MCLMAALRGKWITVSAFFFLYFYTVFEGPDMPAGGEELRVLLVGGGGPENLGFTRLPFPGIELGPDVDALSKFRRVVMSF